MKEIRESIKAGNQNLSSKVADLKKGISNVAGEAKRNILEEKHKSLMDEASQLFRFFGSIKYLILLKK